VATVYRRGSMLWIGFRGPTGRQVNRSSGYEVGQEALAEQLARDLESPKLKRTKGSGRLYLLQPLPEIAQHRVKVGYSEALSNRVKTYRTLCPTARVIASRAGTPRDEVEVLKRFAGAFAQRGREVFDVTTVEHAKFLFYGRVGDSTGHMEA